MQIWKALKGNKKEVATKAAAALLKGKVLVAPTDTVYGLVADATNKKAVQKVFSIKGRQRGKPLPIFIKDIAMAKKLAKVSPFKEAYMKKVWPGQVTLVLESKGVLPKETGTKETIGLRIPKHTLLQEILLKTKKPLTGTSANLAGKPFLSDAASVVLQFKQRKYRPDIILHKGKLPLVRPSKVIYIVGSKSKVLRK